MISIPNPLPRFDFGVATTHWDITLTCFENISTVTGGIGTYHRLLLDNLANTDLKVLVLTRKDNLHLKIGSNIHFVDVLSASPSGPFNFVGDQHDQFSLHCHFAFTQLWADGHTFKFVEFSDYGVDGFYSLRAHKAGAYNLGCTAIRLHSPELMLVEDNGKSFSDLASYWMDRVDRELVAYGDCDMILYGGDAMRDRIVGLCNRFGVSIENKCQKVPHPGHAHLYQQLSPLGSESAAREDTIKLVLKANSFADRTMLENARFFGIFGRIEDRKGQYQFLTAALSEESFAAVLRANNVHILLAGHNVLDFIGNFKLGDLYSLIHRCGLQQNIHFTGRVPQDTLHQLSLAMDGFIFPSVFENYPNALLEVLPTCKPVIVSAAGCMPEIVDDFDGCLAIDFGQPDIHAILQFLSQTALADSKNVRAEFVKRKARFESHEAAISHFYRNPIGARQATASNTVNNMTLGFVIPIFNEYQYLEQTLQSISKALREGDEVWIVDDCSDQANVKEIKQIASKYGANVLELKQNSGPGVARLRALEQLKTDLVQFCDADDMISSDGVSLVRSYMEQDAEVDFVVGIMQCFGSAKHSWVPRNGFIWTAVRENFSHSGSMMRTEVARQSHEDKQRLLIEDWSTNLRVIAQGNTCRMVPVITYYYRRRSGTRSTTHPSEMKKVQQDIVSSAFEQMTFTDPAQYSRLRYMLKSVNVSGLPDATDANFRKPLRYEIVDRAFFKIARNPAFEERLVRLRDKILKRRKT